MPTVVNALQVKKGAKFEHNKLGTVTQPVQFLPHDEKDIEWASWNMDWIEWEGLKQLRRNARSIQKNYKLAAGRIDRSDYIYEPDNEYRDIVDQLSDSNQTPEALELKFYPIIPNVIDMLVAEFSKRNKRVTFRALDEYSHNEIMSLKEQEIESVLVKEAEQKLVMKMIEMGADPNDPEFAKQIQEQTTPQALSRLPEIDKFYSKDYQTLCEKWASKQHLIDEERFKMDELEERAFRDSLICDREFWHFKMNEDDYEVEVWNPSLTFYHKSPDARYISDANWVGHTTMMTVADVIDKFGSRMTEEQLESLESVYPIRAAGYPVTGYQHETHYDGTRSHDWNVSPPGLAHRQLTSMIDNYANRGGDVVNWILGQSEDWFDSGSTYMLRVTTAYWKSQRKVGHLTKIHESGEVTTKIIDETYKVTDDPIYNTKLLNVRDERTLVFGEHIEWIWINQTWGGIKVGPNFPSFWGTNDPGGINPIYLGINDNQIGPLKFQFNGDNNLYDCKLPVEGRVYTDRNTQSTSPVDRMKPFQIGYNIVNNQIADILIDEIGSVMVIDHNTLPKHSMDESWGKHNYAKAYQVMKDFQIMPLDTSMTNTENALNFQHFQTINLEQTQRILSRVQLANYFKQQCFENIGVNVQRMGQQIGQTNTATGIEQAVTGSYTQTENLFTRHSDHLMPRVHQMRTDLAQYYHSNKKSIRLQGMTSNDERINFEINGTDLLLRDINVFASAKANHRDILEKLQRMALENNTTGASLYDLGGVMQADSIGTLNATLKDIETKTQEKVAEAQAHEQQLAEMENQRILQEKKMANDHELRIQAMKDRTDTLVAQIRAAGFGALQDIDENKRSDFQDFMDDLKETQQYQETINMDREKEQNKSNQFSRKMELEREKLQTQKELKQKDLEIAKENKNRFDVKAKTAEKKKNKNS